MNVVIVHGSNDDKEEGLEIPRENERHWKPWLKRELEKRGIEVSNELYPEDWQPDYKNWKAVFEKNKIDKNTVLIGHSAGASFLIRWLSENKTKVNKVILVAPSMGKSSKYDHLDFKDFEYGPEINSFFNRLIIIYSNNDDEDIIESVKTLKEKIGGEIIMLEDRRHFTLEDMGTEKFPELLEEILN